MKRYHLLLLSAGGGILSGLAWTSWFPGQILMISFVPFLLIENHIYDNPYRHGTNSFFIYLLPGIVLFNILTVGWVRAASIPAVITVIMCMSFLMAFTLWLAHLVRLKAGIITASVSIISFWLAFEFLTLQFPILSPWINLGNGLAKDILFIQWFEVTGVAGGTLWILLSNLYLTLAIVNHMKEKKRFRRFLLTWGIIVLIPSIISITRYFTIRETGTGENEVVIIQPNIDPYTEKFTIPFEDQLTKALAMTSGTVSENTSWLLLPETTVDDPFNEHHPDTNKYVTILRDFAEQNYGISIVAGLVSFMLYSPSEIPPSNSARKIDSTGYWFDHFNSAFMIDHSGVKGIYHKSKLVPGIEMQFSAGLGRLISKIVPYLGGTKWGYGSQEERTCFEHPRTGQIAAPLICYESVFGNYVAEYVRKGATVLFIITNDGWWKNTTGYKQHLSYASLRAIETRRQVARCANTGISCIIDIRGKKTEETNWWAEAILKGNISTETCLTPYVKYGDYLFRLSAILSILILAYVFIVLPFRKKFNILTK